MRLDSKLSDVLHVMLHMAELRGPISSDSLAGIMGTNPVVVRRTLSGLRDKGLVRASKGRNGGWVLNCDLSQVTLRDIYIAVGSPRLFAIGQRNESSSCLVEKAVNTAIKESLQEAEALLLERFGLLTLARLQISFHEDLEAFDIDLNDSSLERTKD